MLYTGPARQDFSAPTVRVIGWPDKVTRHLDRLPAADPAEDVRLIEAAFSGRTIHVTAASKARLVDLMDAAWFEGKHHLAGRDALLAVVRARALA